MIVILRQLFLKKIKYSVEATTTLDETQKLITSKAVKDYVDPKFTHYVSVNGTDKSDVSNYNNNGATGTKSIAIGVGAKTDKEQAIVIGNQISVDVLKSIAMGNEITVVDSDKRYASLVIGNKSNLTASGGSIVLNAIAENGITLDKAGWAVALGNHSNIAGGNDIVAIGNNITVTRTGDDNNKNSNLVILGNNAKANDSKNSVVMGYKSEAHANESIVIGDTAKAENGTNNAIVFGKNATVKENITGAVAIGKNAKVETSANDAIALGSNSVANTAGDITGFDTVTGKVRTGTDVNAYGA